MLLIRYIWPLSLSISAIIIYSIYYRYMNSLYIHTPSLSLSAYRIYCLSQLFVKQWSFTGEHCITIAKMWKAFFQQKLLWSRVCVVNWWGFQIGLRIALWGWMRMNGWMCVWGSIDRCWLGCCVELPFPAMISWIFLALAGGCWSLLFLVNPTKKGNNTKTLHWNK